MVLLSLNSEDPYVGYNSSSEKLSFYPQKNEMTYKIRFDFDKNLQKYIKDNRTGGGSIPSKDRGRIWQALSHSDSLHLETLYRQLIHEPTPYKYLIQRDITRTFPHSEMFSQESGQRAMERVLHAYSLYDDEINYCQGLAFLVGPLLMNMPEQQAFSVFVRLMETHGMRTMFTQSMEGLHLRLYQFDRLLEEFLPDIYQFFKEHGVHSQMYLSPWFLTLFAYILPMDCVMRIYDLVFQQGAIETMMRVALSLLMRNTSHILSLLDFGDILTFLTSKRVNDDGFIKDSLQLCGLITSTKLEQLQEEYEKSPKENNSSHIFNVMDNSKNSNFTEKLRYDTKVYHNRKKTTTKKIKTWFGSLSNKSRISPPEIPSFQPPPPVEDTATLNKTIEDLLAAFSQVQQENTALKNELYEQTTTKRLNMETKIKQLSKELHEMTVERNLYLQEKKEAKQQISELRKQLDKLNGSDKCRSGKLDLSWQREVDSLRRSNSIFSDRSSSSSSSSCSSIKSSDHPHVLSLSPPLFEKDFYRSTVTLQFDSSDII